MSPLAGKRVLITRAKEQAGALSELLEAHGAIPVSYPLLRFGPPEDRDPLDSALRHVSEFDWIFFTSQNAAHATAVRASELGVPMQSGNYRVAVVGPTTRQAAIEAGFCVEFVASRPIGIALAEDLGEGLRGKRVLLPRSDRANDDLVTALNGRGAQVTDVVAYRTLAGDNVDPETLRKVSSSCDAILFFNPAAVHVFAEACGPEFVGSLGNSCWIAGSGPVTAEAMRAVGLKNFVVSINPAVAAVVDLLLRTFASQSNNSQSRTLRA